MEFPSYNRRGNGSPIIGQQQVPKFGFEIQVTQQLMDELISYSNDTGLDGGSFLQYVFTRGLTAIRQDLIYAQEERDRKASQQE